MSACIIPSKKRKSNNSTVASKTATKKTPIRGCPATSLFPRPYTPKIDLSACCNAGVPGPAGPQGEQGPAGVAGPCGTGITFQGDWVSGNDYWVASSPSICATDLVRHNGRIYIAILDNIADGNSEPGVGVDWETYWALYSGEANFVVWRGYWQTGVGYAENDYVTHEGSSYMCTMAHTSSASDEPDVEFDYEGGTYWILVSSGDQPEITKEYKDFITSLKDGVMDWVNKIPNWGVEDWLKNIALGAGLIWAGSTLIDMMTVPGTGDGNGGKSYDGSAGYNGTYTPPTVRAVVSDILERAGFDPSEYDVSGIPADAVIEGSFNDNPTAQTALESIILAYQLNWTNVGGQMKFTSRIQNASAVMGDGEFGYHEVGSEDTGPFTFKRLQGSDLPKRVQLQYISRDLDYNSFSQETPLLQSFPTGKDVTLSVPFVLTPTQAREISDYTLIQAHLERNTWSGNTTYKWAKLEPGDVIQTSKGYGRVIQIEEQEEGIISLVFADAGLSTEPEPIYSGPVIIGYSASDYIGSGIPPTPEPTMNNASPNPGYSSVIVVDVPPLQKGDNKPRVFLAVHGYGNPDWVGAHVLKSIDGGITYQQITSVSKEATVGMVATAVANPIDYHIWDDVTTIDVELKTGTLISKSEISVLNGSNLCMIGNEVMSFKNATLIGQSVRGNNIYQISGLLRGLQGTEWVFDDVAHTSDELFVLLDESLVYHEIDLSESRRETLYKAVTFNADISYVDGVAYTVVPLSMVPWKVACPQAIKDCATKTFNVSWIPRSRSMGDGLEDSTEIEHDPDFGGWIVAVISGVTEVRKWQVNTPYTTYTLAQQIEDWGIEQTSVTFRIAAINRLHGSGYTTDFVSGSC